MTTNTNVSQIELLILELKFDSTYCKSLGLIATSKTIDEAIKKLKNMYEYIVESEIGEHVIWTV